MSRHTDTHMSSTLLFPVTPPPAPPSSLQSDLPYYHPFLASKLLTSFFPLICPLVTPLIQPYHVYEIVTHVCTYICECGVCRLPHLLVWLPQLRVCSILSSLAICARVPACVWRVTSNGYNQAEYVMFI